MATITVTTLLDEDDTGATSASPGGTGLSLREAIYVANTSAGADRIVFADDVEGLIRLTTGRQINIRNDALEIDGGGRITITGDRDANDNTLNDAGVITTLTRNGVDELRDNSRAFFVREGADTTLTGLTLTGGRTRNENGHGGVVYAQADVTLIDSVVRGNSTSADNAKGGGLFSRTSITLINSTVTDNSTIGFQSGGGGVAVQSLNDDEPGEITLTDSVVSGSLTTGSFAKGGGVYSDGAVTITRSTVEDNSTRDVYSGGGGVFSRGALTITDSVIEGNSTSGRGSGGGGAYSRDTTTITASVIDGNRTYDASSSGGGLSSRGVVSLTESTIVDNQTAGTFSSGGGVVSRDAISITDSTITGNSAGGDRASGGGVVAYGTVTAVRSSFTENSTAGVESSGGGVYAKGYNSATFTDSLISGNSTGGDRSDGGGAYIEGELVLINTTISGNSTAGAEADGGGFKSVGAEIINSTISGNRASGQDADGGGGALTVAGLTLENSIVLGNDASNGGGDELTLNDINDTAGALTFTGLSIVGVDGDALAGDVRVTTQSTGSSVQADPTLVFETTVANGDAVAGALARNGVARQTIALNADEANPALDAAGAGATATDARGLPAGGGRDLGAYELTTDASLIVTTGDDVLDATDGVISLREAIYFANERTCANTITFAPTAQGLIRLTEGEILIFEDLTIDGGGLVTITGDANGDDVTDANWVTDLSATSAGRLDDNSRIFYALGLSTDLTIDGLTLTGGQAGATGGGAIRTNGDVDIVDSTISGNGTAADGGQGGGVHAFRSVTITNSEISGNLTSGDGAKGGGVYSTRQITVTDSTISGNATSGREARGGGVYAREEITLTDSTISDNHTTGHGAFGGGAATLLDTIITSSTVSDNSTGGDYSRGGGIFGGGAVRVTESTISGNSSAGAAGRGGGIYGRNDVVVMNSTISGNITLGGRADGGGIFAFRNATVTASTITGNSTAADDAEGGGIFAVADTVSGGTLAVTDSIVLGNVAGSTEGDELFKDTSSSSNDGLIELVGANIIGANSAAFDVATQTNGTGSAQNAAAAEVFAATADNNGARAGVLADNGGPVQTIALRADRENPALDASARTDTDARGLSRVDLNLIDNGGVADLGAFELQTQIFSAPTFTTAAALTVAENRTAIATIATADDEAGVSFAITGGADAALFAINTASGALSFRAAPDFEAARDAGANNVYDLQITATDSDGLTTARAFTVRVTDIDEGGGAIGAPVPGATSENDTLVGTAGRDRIDGLGGRDRISGLQDRDTLLGGEGNDVIRGGIGNDNLRGGDGDDVVRGQNGADRLFGNAGDDQVIGSIGEDTLKGNAGDDRLVGGGAADRLFGGAGDDTLIGSAGDDRILGGGGDDLLAGGTGVDRFIFRQNAGDDVLQDFEDGVEQMRIQSGAERFADLAITQVGADAVIAFTGSTITLRDTDAADLTAADFLF